VGKADGNTAQLGKLQQLFIGLGCNKG
jgi:hypothetical protein